MHIALNNFFNNTWEKTHSFPRNSPRRGSRILVRGAQWSWPQGGALSPQFARNRVFSLEIAWKLYDFEEILGATGRAPRASPLGPLLSPQTVSQKSVIKIRTHLEVWNCLFELRLLTWKVLESANFSLPSLCHILWQLSTIQVVMFWKKKPSRNLGETSRLNSILGSYSSKQG